MIERYDIIIIGGGPAGLFSALSIKNKNVVLVEKNKTLGKKLLISGAGQCNYTNNCSMEEFLKKYGDKGRFIRPSLYNLTNRDSIDYFKNMGVDSVIRDDNKVFPSSFKSQDILNALINGCHKNQVNIVVDSEVKYVEYNKEDKEFSVTTKDIKYIGKILIIATGGKSYPDTGSTGEGFEFAKSLGHTIIAPRESLTPVYIENYNFKDLSGISFENINVSLWRNNKKINDFTGDLLLTHTNISGPVIINNSRYIEVGDILKINFTSIKNMEIFKKEFEEKLVSNNKGNVKTVINEYLPRRLTDKIMEIAIVEENLSCSQLNKEKRKVLIELISNYPMKVSSLGGYHLAMVTRGGVSTKEINPKTMESKIIKNLFFAGEVIDLDGDTGGFNIQAAFSTGKLAADSINSL